MTMSSREYLLERHIYCPKRINVYDLNLHLKMGYFVLIDSKYFGISLYEFDLSAPSYFCRKSRALTDNQVFACSDQQWTHDNIIASLLATKISKFVR